MTVYGDCHRHTASCIPNTTELLCLACFDIQPRILDAKLVRVMPFHANKGSLKPSTPLTLNPHPLPNTLNRFVTAWND